MPGNAGCRRCSWPSTRKAARSPGSAALHPVSGQSRDARRNRRRALRPDYRRELAAVGINMNLAPVLDAVPHGSDSIMAQRTFGADAQWVARLEQR